MEVFAAKRKAQAQKEELKQWIGLTLGHVSLGGFAAHRGKDKKATSGDACMHSVRSAVSLSK